MTGEGGTTARARPPEWVLCLVTVIKKCFFLVLDLHEPKLLHSLALYAGERGVSPTGDRGQRYSWIWSMLTAQFRMASLWWWMVDGLQAETCEGVKDRTLVEAAPGTTPEE